VADNAPFPSSRIYLHIEASAGDENPISNISIEYTNFYAGSIMCDPVMDGDIINQFGADQFTAVGQDWSHVFIDMDHSGIRTPILDHCYFEESRLMVRGEGNGEEEHPDFKNCEIYRQAMGLNLILGGQAESDEPCKNYVFYECEVYKSLFGDAGGDIIMKFNCDYVFGQDNEPNVFKSCYIHGAHDRLMHGRNGHIKFKNCKIDDSTDKGVYFHSVDANRDCKVEIYNTSFEGFGDCAVYIDAPDNSDFKLIMHNCVLTNCDGIARMNGERQLDGYITIVGDAEIQNCTIYDNHQGEGIHRVAGIYVANNEELDVTLKNNVVYDNDVGVYYEAAPAGAEEFHNHCVDDNDTDVVDWANWNNENENLDSDPELTDDANDDIHLLATSPCINTGTGDDDPDGSDNDIGAFGGPLADDFSEVILDRWANGVDDYTFHTDMEDYCSIDATINHLDDGVEDFGLKYDMFFMLVDSYVDNNDVLTIESGATIYMDAEVKFTVNGTLDAVGTGTGQGQRILMKPFNVADQQHDQNNIPEASKHDGLVINNGEDIELKYFEIWGSDLYGIYIKYDTDVDVFDNVKSHHNDYRGLYVFGSSVYGYVTIGVENSEFMDNGQEGIKFYKNLLNGFIDNCECKWNGSHGVYAYQGIDWIFKLTSSFNGGRGIYINDSGVADIVDSNIEDNDDQGIYLRDESLDLLGVHIFSNDNNGLYCTNSSFPQLMESTLEDNGVATGSGSAEVYLSSSSWIDLGQQKWNDFMDENVNNANNFLIYSADADAFGLDGTDCYYGEDRVGDGIPDAWSWFRPIGEEDENLMTPATHTDEGTLDEPYNVWSDDEADRLFTQAREAEKAEEYNTAITLYSRLLDRYPTSQKVFKSLQRLRRCWLKDGRDISDHLEFLIEFYCPGNALDLSDAIFYGIIQDQIITEDYVDALATLDDRMDNPRNGMDLLRARYNREMVLLARLEDRDGDVLNSLGSEIAFHEEQVELLEDQIHKYDNGELTDGEVMYASNFELLNIHPNPFNSTTTITFNLHESGSVRIGIFDMQGRETTILANNGHQTAGIHTVTWSPVDLPSGIYLCRMEANGQVATMKLAMVK